MSLSRIPEKIQMQIIKEKHQQIRSILHNQSIDCWLIFVRETIANPDPIMNLVVGGHVVWQSAFIFSFKNNEFKKTAIIGNFDAEKEKQKEIWDEVIGYKEGISPFLQEIIKKLNPSKIAVNFSEDDVISDGLSHGMYLKLCKILPNYQDRFISASVIIQAIKGRKTKTEVELITHACEITERINQDISKHLKIDMSEVEIQALFHKKMNQMGLEEAWERSSCPSVDAGPEKEFGHIGPSAAIKTKLGHTLHNDFGIKYQGYCSDIQRMWFFGKENEIPEELHKAFNVVKNAILKAAEFIKPGVIGHSVDKIARDYIKSMGYDEYDHALGHQVGTNAHDGGLVLAPLWERYGDIPRGIVEENNIFTLELDLKTQNFGMVSLEEIIQVTQSGCRFLIPPQKKIITIQ